VERALCPVLVGREPELNTLEDALLSANRGDGQIVLLAGEAGLGKTRLATEVQRRALKIGMTVLWGGCSEADLSLPYLPFLEAIGNYLATSDLAAVREQLGPVRRELAPLFPQLEPESAVREQGDPTQAKLRLFEAILAMLRVPADKNGVLIVLEDVHWSDASTRELLDYMARRLAGMRLMILGTYRSDELHRKHPLARKRRQALDDRARAPEVRRGDFAPCRFERLGRLPGAGPGLGSRGPAGAVARGLLQLRGMDAGRLFALERAG